MSPLRPYRKPYTPGYPRKLTPEELQNALRPALYKRFSHKTLLTGAIIAGSTVPCGAAAWAAQRDSNSLIDAQARQLVEEILGSPRQANWYRETTIETRSILPSNPPIKVPRIPIGFGNSYSGIFDVEKARKVTVDLFALYGIELKPNVRLEGERYAFTADGFNDELGIGFELMSGDEYGYGYGASKPNEPKESKLQEEELPLLDRDVKTGEIKMFVANAEFYPNMDGDLYTPMRYYLASVVDYLNWVHGGTEIDPESVLGHLPGKFDPFSIPSF